MVVLVVISRRVHLTHVAGAICVKSEKGHAARRMAAERRDAGPMIRRQTPPLRRLDVASWGLGAATLLAAPCARHHCLSAVSSCSSAHEHCAGRNGALPARAVGGDVRVSVRGGWIIWIETPGLFTAHGHVAKRGARAAGELEAENMFAVLERRECRQRALHNSDTRSTWTTPICFPPLYILGCS